MLATLLGVLLTAPAAVPSASADLATPLPRAADVAPAPLVLDDAAERRRARVLAARNGQLAGASVVIGAAAATYLAAMIHANLACGDWGPFNPECETTDATRRSIFHGAVVGMAVVPPVFAGRGMARADPDVGWSALWRGLPFHLLGVAAFAVLPSALRDGGALGFAAVGGAAVASSIFLAPRFAAGAPLAPPRAAALPERDPALLR